MNEAIAIIGMSCRFPGSSNSVREFWDNIKAGKFCIAEISKDRWDVDEFYHPDDRVKGKSRTKWSGLINDFDKFDAQFFGINGREAEQIDPQQRHSLELVWEAFEDAGLKPSDYVKSRTGVFACGFTLDYKILQFANEMNIGTHTAVGSMMTMLSNRISYTFDFRGPSMSIDTACSSSLVALHEACESLKNGECDLALAGGVELLFTPEYYIAESKAGMLSPTGSCKTFDEKADGYVRGEGGGFLVIKRLSDAERDGDNILAVIRKSLVNQDGKTVGITVPNGEAQEQLLRDVYANANVKPEEVQYVELHGTGTGVGDPIEANVMANFFGQNRNCNDKCFISSVKANIGHLEATSGVASVIKTVCSMNEGVVAPQIGMNKLNPKMEIDGLGVQIPLELSQWPKTEKKIAGINSFGFGGTNAHIILEEAPKRKEKKYDGKAVYPEYKKALTITAKSENSLKKTAKQYIAVLKKISLDDVIVALKKTREDFDMSLTVVGKDSNEVIQGLNDFINGNINPMISYKPERRKGKIAFVYSGMGPQWYAMGLELFKENKVYHDTFVKIDEAFSKYLNWSLIEELHKDENSSNIGRTDYAQPMNFALQVALTRVWESMGVYPDGVVGHSVGEIAALYIAGIYSLDEACRITYNRSRCQYLLTGKGTMLAAGIPAEEAEKYLEGHEDRASVAAINSYKSVTLAGDEAVLKEIAQKLDDKNIFNKFLRVNIPYHSVFMNEIKTDLLDSLGDLHPLKPNMPFYTTADGEREYKEELDAYYWWKNVSHAVHFAKATSLLLEDGYDVFLEIGPHRVLCSNINEIAEEGGYQVAALASIKRKQPEMQQIYSTYAELISSGVSIDWKKIYWGEFKPVKLPYYQWDKKQYWKEPIEHYNRRTGKVDTKLLGFRRNIPTVLWENNINTWKLPFIKDHCISGNELIAGAHYIEMAVEAVRSLCNDSLQNVFLLENIQFMKTTFLDEFGCAHLFVSVDQKNGTIDIYSGDQEQFTNQEKAFSASIVRKQLPERQYFDVKESEMIKLGEHIKHSECYERLEKIGFTYGSYFQRIDEAWVKDNSCIIKIGSLVDAGIPSMDTLLHPVLLDASFQAIMLISRDESHTMIPVSIGKYMVYDNIDGDLYAKAVIINNDENIVEGNIYIYNQTGEIKAIVEKFVAKNMETDENHNLVERDFYRWLYNIEWKQQEIINDEISLDKKLNIDKWIILDDKNATGEKIITVSGWNKDNISIYSKNDFDYNNESKLKEICDLLDPKKKYGILMLSGLDITFDPESTDKDIIVKYRDELLRPIWKIVNFLNENGLNYKIWTFTQNAVSVESNDELNILQAPLLGMARVIYQNESIQTWGAIIDADCFNDETIKSIVSDIDAQTREREIAYRKGKRFVSRLNHMLSITEGIPVMFSKDKTYIITGGMGSLGKITAEWMQYHGAEEIILLGRSQISPKITEELRRITQSRNKLNYRTLDITDINQVTDMIEELRKNGKKIGGVFHTAGVLKDNLMVEMTDEEFNEVYDPKAIGSWNMSRATWDDDLDFFITYSSAGAVVTSVGQINYASANAFMDALTYYRRKNGKVSQSIAWGPWAVGMVKERNLIKHYKEVRGMEPIYAESGMQALERVFGKTFGHVVVCGTDWDLALKNYPGKPALFNHLAEDEHNNSEEEQQDFLDTIVFAESNEERVQLTIEAVRKIISDITYVETKNLKNDQSLNEIGIDSIISTEIRNKIYEVCSAKIAITDILKGTTITKLASKILNVLEDKINEREAEYEALLNTLEKENVQNEN